jgi:hypothetical protein
VSKLPRYLGVTKCGFTNIPMKKGKKKKGEKKKTISTIVESTHSLT